MKAKLLKKVRDRFKVTSTDGLYSLFDIRNNEIILDWKVRDDESQLYDLMIAKSIEMTIGKLKYRNLKEASRNRFFLRRLCTIHNSRKKC